jgi:hypothetical protein
VRNEADQVSYDVVSGQEDPGPEGEAVHRQALGVLLSRPVPC